MTLEDDVEILRRLFPFRELEREALRLLAFQATLIELNENEHLFRAGDLADGAFVVVSGSIAITAKEEVDVTDYIASPGALIGRTALVTELNYSGSATATEPSSVMKISRSGFQKVLYEYPAAAAKIKNVIASELKQLTRELRQICQ